MKALCYLSLLAVGVSGFNFLGPDNLIYDGTNTQQTGVLILTPEGFIVEDEQRIPPQAIPGGMAVAMLPLGVLPEAMFGTYTSSQPGTFTSQQHGNFIRFTPATNAPNIIPIQSAPPPQSFSVSSPSPSPFPQPIPVSQPLHLPPLAPRPPPSVLQVTSPSASPSPTSSAQVLSIPDCDPVSRPNIDMVVDGVAYHFSWCHDGSMRYSWPQALLYCTKLGSGFTPVTPNSHAQNTILTNIIKYHSLKFVWTGGVKDKDGTWTWITGSPPLFFNWSSSGSRLRKQPDNAEGREECLGVLNNVYNDGITWHDIGCQYEKPVVCQATL